MYKIVTKTYLKLTYLPTYVTLVTVVTVVTVVAKQLFSPNKISQKKIFIKKQKTQNMTKLKNSSCDETQNVTTQKLKM